MAIRPDEEIKQLQEELDWLRYKAIHPFACRIGCSTNESHEAKQHVPGSLRVSYITLKLLADEGHTDASEALKAWHKENFFYLFVGCKWSEKFGFQIGHTS